MLRKFENCLAIVIAVLFLIIYHIYGETNTEKIGILINKMISKNEYR